MTAPLTDATWVIELFIHGQSDISAEAVDLVRRLCDARLHHGYQLTVTDILQQPDRTSQNNVIATPTLVRQQPGPVRHTVGRLTEQRVLECLGLSDQHDV